MSARIAVAAVILAMAALSLSACDSHQCTSAAGYVDMKGGGGGGGHGGGGGGHASGEGSSGGHGSDPVAPHPAVPFIGGHPGNSACVSK